MIKCSCVFVLSIKSSTMADVVAIDWWHKNPLLCNLPPKMLSFNKCFRAIVFESVFYMVVAQNKSFVQSTQSLTHHH